MGIFGSIISKIFGTSEANAAEATATAAPASAETAPGALGGANVDVAATLDALNDANPEELDWRVSIVDLMKVLGLDSSLTARKALATEMHFSGDQGDSASMNIWLHEQIIGKLAANGGKVPADLLKK
jgi:Domain of unknown function (DUF3597)